jgi:hypothetical protein
LGLPVEGHTWIDKGNWGYRSFTSQPDLTKAYEQLLLKLRPLVGRGLSAAIYTQTTDVEVEVNGLMTYDRKVIKIPESTAPLARKLYLPPPVVSEILPTAEKAPQQWRYTFQKPADGWQKPEFADGGWKEGPAGFGTATTPNTRVRTEWNSPDIWIRRTFDVKSPPGSLSLRVHHDEDTEVFLNGVKIAALDGFTDTYAEVPLDDAAAKALKAGTNTLAVHTRQTRGGQYIDLGLVEIREAASR